MDEPFGAIDPINREKLQDGFLEIQSKIEKTIVFVTHDIREAIKLGDKIAILDEGKLVQYADTMEVINEPANEFVEDLLGADRALKGLELLRVKDNYITDITKIVYGQNGITVGEAVKTLKETERKYSFIVDSKGKLKGYVLLKSLLKKPEDTKLGGELIRKIETIQPHSTLMEAMSLMMSSGLSSLPVIDDRNTLLGILRFRDLTKIVSSYSSVAEE
jgi:osmoprotectant transport system ATP-binding protein